MRIVKGKNKNVVLGKNDLKKLKTTQVRRCCKMISRSACLATVPNSIFGFAASKMVICTRSMTIYYGFTVLTFSSF